MPQPHLLIRETQELKPQPLCLHFYLQNISYQNLNIQICSQTKHSSQLTTGVLSLRGPAEERPKLIKQELREKSSASTAAPHKNLVLLNATCLIRKEIAAGTGVKARLLLVLNWLAF